MKAEFPLLATLTMNGEMASLPEDVKLVSAQEATDRYWYDENDVWEFAKDFGNMAPPYPRMWLESTAHVPAGSPVNGKVSAEKSDHRVGYGLESYNRDDFMHEYGSFFAPGILDASKFKWAYAVQVYMDGLAEYLTMMGGMSAYRAPAMGFLLLDGDGNYLEHTQVFEGGVPKDVQTFARDSLWGPAKAAFFAVSMMNCRNVSLSTQQTRQRGGKKSRRAVKPSVEYKTIHLPTPRAESSALSRSNASTQKLHTARGHFKTYTEDSPLMGKHVGTYYWGWQVRGNRTNGEVISSYRVGALV